MTVTQAGYPTLRRAHHFFALTTILVPHREFLHLVDLAGEAFGGDPGCVLAKGVGERAVVPQGAALAAGKAAPHGLAVGAQVGIDGACIMGLVGEAHREAARGLVRKAGDIGLLARMPGGLGLLMRIGAVSDDLRDILAEASADGFELAKAALILDRVMKQRSDGLILVRPVLERDRGDGKEVGDIGDARALAGLCPVEATGLGECIVETVGEEGGGGGVGHRKGPADVRPNTKSARQLGCGRAGR